MTASERNRLFPPERSVGVRELLDALLPNASLDLWRVEFSEEIGDIDGRQSSLEEFERDVSGRNISTSIPESEALSDVRHFVVGVGGKREVEYDVLVTHR